VQPPLGEQDVLALRLLELREGAVNVFEVGALDPLGFVYSGI
jgi:hypothetical protein